VRLGAWGVAVVRQAGEPVSGWVVREAYEGTAAVTMTDLVEAQRLDIEGGALVFRDRAGALVKAYGPGAWWEVAPVPEDGAAQPASGPSAAGEGPGGVPGGGAGSGDAGEALKGSAET
jgi:hypothetical protein